MIIFWWVLWGEEEHSQGRGPGGQCSLSPPPWLGTWPSSPVTLLSPASSYVASVN